MEERYFCKIKDKRINFKPVCVKFMKKHRRPKKDWYMEHLFIRGLNYSEFLYREHKKKKNAKSTDVKNLTTDYLIKERAQSYLIHIALDVIDKTLVKLSFRFPDIDFKETFGVTFEVPSQKSNDVTSQNDSTSANTL